MPRSSRLFFTSGALSGLIIAVPLAISATWIGAVAASHLAGAQTAPAIVSPAESVNRSAKSSRLPLSIGTDSRRPASVQTVTDAATTVVSKGEKEKARSRTNSTMPRGCLSAVGGLAAGAAAQEMTICVADISTIQ